ncbi:MAG TPA: UDP-2,4-diacetamido-2,4,6-trideoxy-beta-L-altropyranose hydrolase, partial [Pseudoneobacillus sp.]|nr:UDP-2,4-diacetamido-2,4,6-trideoxy-beta-L-altropyranose hydrolase [Pseudoneobacillus sp.]
KGFHYHCQIDYIASLMERADFSIGAGGSTTWERCFLGLPSSSTIVASNQVDSTETTASLGAIWNIGWHEKVTVDTYRGLLLSLKDRQEELKQMSLNGLELTKNPDGADPWLKHILEVTK